MLKGKNRSNISRRKFLVGTGQFVAAGSALSIYSASGSENYFSLGVASGAPRPDRVILWTRLAPNPLNGGGMSSAPAEVRVRVYKDPELRSKVIDDVFITTADEGHSVHYHARGLGAGREYWYQFSFDDVDSPIGRTKTADPRADEAKIALAYCQNYESGFFSAYRDLADWAPECVMHTGDYIYEGAAGKLGATMRRVAEDKRQMFERVRTHVGPEITTLWDYRNRHAQYKTDKNLQAAHAAAPWIVAMDDHEVDNNWSGSIPQDPQQQTPLEFRIRKLAAFQAYYEHMPIEKPPILQGTESQLQMYGAFRIGPAQLHLLDTRQFRDDQSCGDGRKVYCEETSNPGRSMLGKTQETWLFDQLRASASPHNVIASQVWFTPYKFNAENSEAVRNLDSWDGYPAARSRLSDVLASGVNRPLILSGDWHIAMASTLHADPFDRNSARVGHELVGSSISSGCPWSYQMQQVRDQNPQVEYLNGEQRGYLRTTFTKDDCIANFRMVRDSGLPDSPAFTDLEMRTSEV